jgi:hypothetical protein
MDIVALIVGWIASKLLTSRPVQSPPSAAHRRYTPSFSTNAAATTGSVQGASSNAVPSHLTGSNILPAQSSAPNTSAPPTNVASLWVIFGIRDLFEWDDIENIEIDGMLMNDATFFDKLRRLDSKYRWPLLSWMSPWNFAYCKFVQVSTTYLLKRFCKGQGSIVDIELNSTV